jgi:hypothetical protein
VENVWNTTDEGGGHPGTSRTYRLHFHEKLHSSEWNSRSHVGRFEIASESVRFGSESRQVTTDHAPRQSQCVSCPNLSLDRAPRSMSEDETQPHHKTEVPVAMEGSKATI